MPAHHLLVKGVPSCLPISIPTSPQHVVPAVATSLPRCRQLHSSSLLRSEPQDSSERVHSRNPGPSANPTHAVVCAQHSSGVKLRLCTINSSHPHPPQGPVLPPTSASSSLHPQVHPSQCMPDSVFLRQHLLSPGLSAEAVPRVPCNCPRSCLSSAPDTRASGYC